jgi:hypothetical protein
MTADFAALLFRRKCLCAPQRPPSSSCQKIGLRTRTLASPMTTANSALQYNEVYPPPSPPRHDPAFLGAADKRFSFHRKLRRERFLVPSVSDFRLVCRSFDMRH